MPVPNPPIVTPIVGELPDRGQTEVQFDTNQQNFVNYQANFGPEINELADWLADTANQTEIWANSSESNAEEAKQAAESAENDANRAEEAAVTAQEAAGLPPLPTFGRVLHTEGADNSKNAAFTAETSRWYEIYSVAGGFAITAPASPVLGDWFAISYTHKVNLAQRCHIARNGSLIMGFAQDLQLTKGFKTYLFRYTVVNGVYAWRFS